MTQKTYLLLLFVAVVSSASTLFMKNKFFPEAYAVTSPVTKQSSGQFSECFSTNMWLTTGRRINDGEIPEKTVKIPAGWTVVGGSGAVYNEPTMILCR